MASSPVPGDVQFQEPQGELNQGELTSIVGKDEFMGRGNDVGWTEDIGMSTLFY